jgi:hypothetical protein
MVDACKVDSLMMKDSNETSSM